MTIEYKIRASLPNLSGESLLRRSYISASEFLAMKWPVERWVVTGLLGLVGVLRIGSRGNPIIVGY